MKKTIFRGSAVAIVTPMDKSGKIDYNAFENLLNFQMDNGTDAIVVNGTTGESATLDEDEAMELVRTAVHHVGHRIPVIAGTGSNRTSHAISMSKRAELLGADGLLLVTPYYNKASQKGLEEHFLAVANEVNRPMILYNVPSRTGVSINPETCQTLSAHENICAIKDAGGNISVTARIAALCGDHLDIYSGNDDQTVPILSLGGKGVISVAANIVPDKMHQMCQLYFDGEAEKSGQMQLELLELLNAMFMDVNPIAVKFALSVMGYCSESYRLPLTSLKAEDKEKMMGIMKRYLLL